MLKMLFGKTNPTRLVTQLIVCGPLFLSPGALARSGDPTPNRRLLNTKRDDCRKIIDKCGKLKYDGSIFVDTHFRAVFYPTTAAIKESCPTLVYQLQVEEDLSAELNVDVIPDIEDAEFLYLRKEGFSTGTYTLNQVAAAVDSVEVPPAGAWDLLYNSCFSMVTQLAVSLDWDIDNGMIPYISQNLREYHTHENVQKAIKTKNFAKHFNGDFVLEPVLDKTLEAWIGRDNGLDVATQGQLLLDFITNADPEKDEALAVFYDALVDSYVDREVRPARRKKRALAKRGRALSSPTAKAKAKSTAVKSTGKSKSESKSKSKGESKAKSKGKSSARPTFRPTPAPTPEPSASPTFIIPPPTPSPTPAPSASLSPSASPTIKRTNPPTPAPSASPTINVSFRRRSLLNTQHEDYREIIDECGELKYDNAIFVDAHFRAVFYPTAAAIKELCPTLVYQLRFDDDNWQVDRAKQVEEELSVEIVVDVIDDILDAEFLYLRKEGFSTGTYTLNQVAAAVDSVQVPPTGAWDLLYNSCFSIATQLAVSLDWDVDDGMLRYISQNLREHHTHDNVQKAIKTKNFVKYFNGDFLLEPVLDKTLEAWIGGDNGLDIATQGQLLLDFITNADPEKDEALSVFYDALVESYVDREVRPARKKNEALLRKMGIAN